MKLFYVLIALFMSSPAAFAADAIDLASGSWGIDVSNVPDGVDAKALDEFRGCQKSPVIITVNRETMRYKAVHTGEDNFVGEGPILTSGKNSLSLQYDDEDRLMKNGEPHIWHMFFISPDKFYWILGTGIRADQRDGIIETARVRCQFAGV